MSSLLTPSALPFIALFLLYASVYVGAFIMWWRDRR